jgi:hypothetical protein
MKSYFYERSAYRLSEQPVPACFLRLDERFDAELFFEQAGETPLSVILAESVCSRMADVEMFAFLMEDTRRRHRLDADGEIKIAVLTRSFLIGYLGAVRALLDACATTLAILAQLPLKPGERSFGQGEFWQQLVTRAPNVHRKYHPMRVFFNDVGRWCGETADRIPPLQVLYNQFGQYSSRDSHLRVIDESADLGRMGSQALPVHWVDAIDLHRRWKLQLLTLCERICQDIEASI